MRSLAAILSTALFLAPYLSAQVDASAHWPRWRGPEGSGLAPGKGAPVRWSADENIRWTLDLPGRGSSTPIVWGELLFVTTAVEKEGPAEAEPEQEDESELTRERGGRGSRGGRGAAPTTPFEFRVLAVRRADGGLVWNTLVAETVPHEGGHQTNTQASASPITDGEHVFAFFGSRGLYCLDMEGEVVWSKQFGRMQTRNQFGEGASPALHGDTLVVVWDHEGEDFIAALDKRSGEERWRQSRDEVTTWSTPLVVPVGDRHQVVTTATGASRAYDLETGEPVWWIAGMTTNCIPSPIYRDGVVWLMSGFRGSALQAIRLEGAKGDLAESENLLWSLRSGTSYVPSALLDGEFLYFLRGNNGVLSCVVAATGEVVYDGQRLGDIRTVYASPVAADEYVYVPSREGLTLVFRAGPVYEEVAANQLDDTFDASPVIVGGTLYLRGWDKLYCIGESEG